MAHGSAIYCRIIEFISSMKEIADMPTGLLTKRYLRFYYRRHCRFARVNNSYPHLAMVIDNSAIDIFNDMSQAEMIEDVNAERVAKAYNELRKNLYSKKLKIDILGLPKEGGSHGD